MQSDIFHVLNGLEALFWGWMLPMAWQVALLVGILWIVTRYLMKRTSARFRYALWMLVPIRLLVPPTLAIVTGWGWWLMPEKSVSENSERPFATSWVAFNPMIGGPPLSVRSDPRFLSSEDFGDQRRFSAADIQPVVSSDSVVPDSEFRTANDFISPTMKESDSAERSTFSWRTFLIAGWCFGAVVLFARLWLGKRSVARIIRRAQPASTAVIALAEQCRSLLGMRRPVPVLSTSTVDSPMLVGVWRPHIVLPEGVERCLSTEELRAILIHELHHVQRRDGLVHFVESVLQAIYWFHPAVWLATRETRRLREMSCDEATVASLRGQRRDYGLGMVKVAEMMTMRCPAMSLPFVSSKNQMSARVLRILDPSLPIGRRLSFSALLAVIAMALVLIPSAGRLSVSGSIENPVSSDSTEADVPKHESAGNDAANASDSPAVGAEPRQKDEESVPDVSEVRNMRMTVFNEEGKPIAGAKILANSGTKDTKYEDKRLVRYSTDDQGNADIKIYPQLHLLRLWVSHAGDVTLFVHWEEGETDRIPAEIRLQLQRGTELGGAVIDSEGKPVRSARIELVLDKGGVKSDANINSGLDRWLANGEDAAVTDEDGRWSINNVPQGADLELHLVVSHPDFECDTVWTPIAGFGLTLESMRDKSGTITLRRGIAVTGRVLNPDGEPVSGAMIVWGDRPYWENGSQETKTDEQGQFKIPAQKPGEIRLTVVAKGWMPETRMVEVKRGTEPIDFRLRRGKKLHVKIIDPDGNPIPKARFHLTRWRGVESLYNHQHSNVLDSGIPTHADENGEFIWDWAPDDAVKFSIQNLKGSKYVELTANDSIQTIKLSPSFALTGTVESAASGEPVVNYTVIPITFWSELENARGISQSSSLKRFSLSHFSMEGSFHEGVKQNQFRFEAPGYRVIHTRRFGVDEPPQSITIRLEPTPVQTGRVLDTDGRPVITAKVAIAKPQDSLLIDEVDGFLAANEYRLNVDESGTFPHATQTSRFAVIAATKDGYAEKYCSPGESVGDLILRPWSRVEGILFQDGTPVPNASIRLNPIRQLGGDNPHVQDQYFTTTDPLGRFAFDRVPPVPSTISSTLTSWEDYPITSNQVVPLDLQPGETRTVRLGGDGLQLHGRVQLKGGGTDKIEFRYGIHRLVRADGGEIKVPEHARHELEYKAGEQLAYEKKLAGPSESLMGMEQHFVKLNPDGSFLINGVRPGSYRFLLQVYEPPTGCLVDPVGYGYLEFNTSDYRVVDNRLDMGIIEVALKPIPKVGEQLANFTWQNLDGTSHKVADQRGKFVLLDFWATWCGPCIEAMPEIKRLHRELAGDDRFRVLSLSIDAEVENAKAFVREKELDWPQGFVGDITNSSTGRALGINSVPLYILLDPDGRILIRSAGIEEVTKTLKELMESK